MDNLNQKQLKHIKPAAVKDVLTKVFMLLVLILVILPFWTSLQDLLTRLVMGVGWYRYLQDLIVPYELRIVGVVLSGLGMPISVGNSYIEWATGDGTKETIYLIWNCVGWQSLVLFILTLMTGLSGKYTKLSKLETLFFGILGTYLINIFRLILVVAIYFQFGRPLGIVFHDYFSNILTLTWLFFFWWFAYKYILES